MATFFNYYSKILHKSLRLRYKGASEGEMTSNLNLENAMLPETALRPLPIVLEPNEPVIPLSLCLDELERLNSILLDFVDHEREDYAELAQIGRRLVWGAEQAMKELAGTVPTEH